MEPKGSLACLQKQTNFDNTAKAKKKKIFWKEEIKLIANAHV
jgi:hypothetical protein